MIHSLRSKPRQRLTLYAILGLVFGIVDWYYLDGLAHFSWGRLGDSVLVVPVIILLNYGIWLVPLVPAVTYEGFVAKKSTYPVFAGMLTWACAIFSYYAYYAVLLSMGKLVQLEHLNVFGEKYAGFWTDYWQMFNRIILQQFIEWIIIALAGGAILGALSFWLWHKRSPDPQQARKKYIV